MQSVQLQDKVNMAARWSILTQIGSKLISPITNMILARLLTPNAFGVVATINMVISFVDMFTDAGFQKYLVQKEFKNEEERNKSTNVAFITNLIISLLIWIVIIVYRNKIASLVGNPGLGNVLAIACVQLPITSFSSIQMALYRRSFDFKSLFKVQMIVALIPLMITVPLAIAGFSYWSIIIGSTCGMLYNSLVLTMKSKWKPYIFYDFKLLKEMFEFSFWTLLESISIWLTAWIDTLIIGASLNPYYLGLYKTSLSLVNSLMAMITSSISPVLFSTLSRLQNEEEQFRNIFYKIQKIIAYLAFPIGMGIFLYKEMITRLMLGEKWLEASSIVGIWALTSAIRLVMTSIYSEVYRSKGKPKLSLLVQTIHLLILIPTCLYGLKYGFWGLVYSRALVRLEGVVTGLIIMHFVMKFNAKEILKNILKPIIYTFIMAIGAILLKTISTSDIWNIISIVICIGIYITLIFTWSKDDFLSIIRIFNKK